MTTMMYPDMSGLLEGSQLEMFHLEHRANMAEFIDFTFCPKVNTRK